MRRTEVLGILIIASVIMPVASGDVSISIGCYNNEDVLSIDISGENFGYGGMLMLEPDFMWYQNGGSSTYPESWYSFSASLNGESLGSGARTNSGGFKWSAELGSGWMGDDRANAFELSAKHMVKDGELDTFAKSPTISTTESISAVDAVYMESIASGREQFSLKGYGRTSADTRERSKPSTDPSPQVIDPLPAYIKLTGQVQYLEVGPIPSTTNQVDQLLPVGS
ncbi:MAG: hypothetical protein QXI70_05685, partial [Methanothrix sp.]